MSDANEKASEDKEAKNKARREKIEKIGLCVKNIAVKTKEKALPIVKKAVPAIKQGIGCAVGFVKKKLKKGS
jgi:hypothetical protein